MNFDRVDKRIHERALLDFGQIFSNSIELFKKVWFQGFVTLVLTFVCMLPFYGLIYIPLLAVGIADPEIVRREEVPISVLIGMMMILPIFLVGVLTISLALMAAFLRICKLRDLKEMGDDDYFFYLKNGRWVKLFTLALIFLGIMVLGMITCGLGLFYAMVPLSLVPAFIAFNDELSPIDIVKLSFHLGNKNWLVIFGLIIVMGLLAELGIVICCFGIFFTAMLSKIPVYFCYKEGVGFPEDKNPSI